MNRYDRGFRSLPPIVRSSGLHKAEFAREAILQHRHHGFGPKDDEAIVRQFDLSGMAEFWQIELSEPMDCNSFAHWLAIHFFEIKLAPASTEEQQKASGPAASQYVDHVKANIRAALRAARAAGEPWLIEKPEPPPSSKPDPSASLGFVPSDVVIVPPDPPSDGIDLSKLRVRPRAAAEWLFAMPKRRHLVPPSLAVFLQPSAKSVSALIPTVARPERRRGPKSVVQPRVESEMRAALARGTDLTAMKQEEMAALFKAAASTCRKALAAVLSEIGEIGNSD